MERKSKCRRWQRPLLLSCGMHLGNVDAMAMHQSGQVNGSRIPQASRSSVPRWGIVRATTASEQASKLRAHPMQRTTATPAYQSIFVVENTDVIGPSCQRPTSAPTICVPSGWRHADRNRTRFSVVDQWTRDLAETPIRISLFRQGCMQVSCIANCIQAGLH